MKKIILLLLLITAFFRVNGQSRQESIQKANVLCNDLEKLNLDIDVMYNCLNVLNNDSLKYLMDIFKLEGKAAKGRIRDAAKIQRLINGFAAKITNNIKHIGDALPVGATCFHEYLNKELQDYIHSLEMLKTKMNGLVEGNVYSDNEFILAYHYMSSSRANLMAAMDNLYRYHVLRKEAQVQLPMKIDEVELRIGEAKKEINKNTNKQSVVWGVLGGVIGGIVGGLIMLNN